VPVMESASQGTPVMKNSQIIIARLRPLLQSEQQSYRYMI
jgi:hypothetical protein